MESTSIGISLRTLENCRQELAARGKYVTMRALYIESNPDAYQRLAAYLTARGGPVRAESIQGDFVALRGRILDWVGRDAFAFFFIDPTGFKEIGVSTLAPLRSSPEEREVATLSAYRNNCEARMPSPQNSLYRPRSAYARVMYPDQPRPKYHLVYFTSHPLGIIEFMTISEGVDFIQQRVRAEIKSERRARDTRSDDLFGASSYLTSEATRNADAIDTYWLTYLHQHGGTHRVGVVEFADILETSGWFPNELQMSLKRLIGEKRVRNRDAPRARPKQPLHFKENSGAGEVLQLGEL